ncbi:uncharacterized protein LOC128523779 isoform X2 [Clarias gariepinus]|uniref:uncharacterized protein LOC128523779 isoform X2 n=1 Tax=Clarias gariepinus TaxID=13013 RepID=UPI00234DC5F9|nr:uncharacterized protein LOC128523779 isoform X2 [Clarias gariepinus]
MMEKNALLFMVLFLSVLNVGGAANIYIPTGANYTFLSTITETIEAIQWTHANNIVVELDSFNSKPHWYRYSERGELNIKTGDLTLRVVKADSGVFKGQFQVKGVLRYAEYTVTVIDPVPKPSVTCVRHNETQVTLKCKVNSPVQPKFKWTGPNEFSQDGDSLQISNTGTSAIYYCIVSNNVSNDSTEFNLSKCFPAPLKLHQVRWEASVYSHFKISPEMFNRIQVWTMAGPLKDIHREMCHVPFTKKWLPSGYSTI